MTPSLTAQVSLADALVLGPPPAGNLAVAVFAHGSLVVEFYAPAGHDPQQPHARDELYFVARGMGWSSDGQRRRAVGAGAFLFVAAGRKHRFEDFSEDFAVWVGLLRTGGWRAARLTTALQPTPHGGDAASARNVRPRHESPLSDATVIDLQESKVGRPS